MLVFTIYLLNIILLSNKTNKYTNYNLTKRHISKENLITLFPILLQEYIYFENNHDTVKDLMCFYNSLKNRRNYDII